jgi:HK97 family phage portal protein
VSWFTRLIGTDRKSINSSLELFREIYGGRLSSSGKTINLQTALQVATVFACARVIAEGIAQVPLKLFESSSDGKTRAPADKHPLYWLLYRKPNSFQTSFEYRETVGLHLSVMFRHYSFINRVGGRIVELVPIEPHRVRVQADDAFELTYFVKGKSGAEQEFPADSIWHLRGPSWNGWEGLDSLYLARDILGLTIALEESQARFHANGAQVSGTYSVEGKLTDDQYKQLRGWLDKEHVTSRNTGTPMILDRGAKWLAQQMSGVDAQHLESRRYQCEEVCRNMRVMPIMIGYSDKATTYASSEQMFLSHVIHTLSPWYERISQSIDVNLIGDKDAKAGISAKFLAGALLKGSLRDTAVYLKTLVADAGVLMRNEAREYLDYNPVDGLDEPLIPPRATLEPEPGENIAPPAPVVAT